jgi:hypothetical protein
MKTLSTVVVSLVVCAMFAVAGCRRGEANDTRAARPGAFDPCVMALAPHQGTGDVDAGIARVQQRAREAADPVTATATETKGGDRRRGEGVAKCAPRLRASAVREGLCSRPLGVDSIRAASGPRRPRARIPSAGRRTRLRRRSGRPWSPDGVRA